MVHLKYKSKFPVTEVGKLFLCIACDLFPFEPNFARIGLIKRTDQVEQSCFSGPAWAGYGNFLIDSNFQVQSIKNFPEIDFKAWTEVSREDISDDASVNFSYSFLKLSKSI